MGDAILGYRILQCPDNMLLPYDLFKFLRTIFSRQNAVFVHAKSFAVIDKKG
jgi:hypothetical protein